MLACSCGSSGVARGGAGPRALWGNRVGESEQANMQDSLHGRVCSCTRSPAVGCGARAAGKAAQVGNSTGTGTGHKFMTTTKPVPAAGSPLPPVRHRRFHLTHPRVCTRVPACSPTSPSPPPPSPTAARTRARPPAGPCPPHRLPHHPHLTTARTRARPPSPASPPPPPPHTRARSPPSPTTAHARVLARSLACYPHPPPHALARSPPRVCSPARPPATLTQLAVSPTTRVHTRPLAPPLLAASPITLTHRRTSA